MQAMNKLILSNFSKLHSGYFIREFSDVTKQKWDVLCAVSLERNPIITNELSEIENKVAKMMQDLEQEQSHKSNFEIRMDDDEKRRKLLKSGKLDIEDLDKAGQQTAHDFMDKCTEEMKNFDLAPRINSKKDNPKSSARALDRHLLLVVKDKLGTSPVWLLPQGKHKEHETLRQTAERILSEKVGPEIKARFYGNAPNGFYKYKYPKSVQNETVGAKIFFYKAQFLSGDIDIKKGSCSDYQWATRTELSVLPLDYSKSVKTFLIDEQ